MWRPLSTASKLPSPQVERARRRPGDGEAALHQEQERRHDQRQQDHDQQRREDRRLPRRQARRGVAQQPRERRPCRYARRRPTWSRNAVPPRLLLPPLCRHEGRRASDYLAQANAGHSREACAPPRLACSPSHKEGAERRQALGCSGTRRRASDVGPQARGRRARTAHDAGRSPLGAPPRRFIGPGRLRLGRATFRALLARLSTRSPCRVWPFTRSARSGGRAVYPGPPGAWLRASPQDAASRSDSGSSPETPSVSGTAGR